MYWRGVLKSTAAVRLDEPGIPHFLEPYSVVAFYLLPCERSAPESLAPRSTKQLMTINTRVSALSGAIFLAALLAGATGALAQSAQPSTDQAGESRQSRQPSLPSPLASRTIPSPYQPITPRGRVRWFIASTIGPQQLVGGVFTSAIATAIDSPREYGPGWGGFGDRFGMRLTGVSTGNAMEASLGALWGEDPRYFRAPEKSFRVRFRFVIKETFVARRRDGTFAPAYARFVAIPGNNFLSNTWRADTEADAPHAALRTLLGFAGRAAGNAFDEFWPDVEARVFHRRS
jgi:hypothetical protein